MTSYKDPEPVELEIPDLSRFKKPVIIVLAALIVLLVGLKIAKMGHMPLEQVTRITTLQFPASAKLLHSSYAKSEQGDRLMALIEMTRADAQTFITSAVSQKTDRCSVSDTDRLGVVNDLGDGRKAPEWWNPDSASRFLAMCVNTTSDAGPATYARVLAALGDGDRTKVYLLWSP